MSNPLIDYTPSPCRNLVKDGKWQVPPEQRPASVVAQLPEDRESVPPPRSDRAVPGMVHRTIVTQPRSKPQAWTEHKR